MPDEEPTNETPVTPETPVVPPEALEIDGFEVELAPDTETPEALQPTSETPPPVTPATPAVPAVPEKPALPPWLSAIPEEQRVDAAAAFLETLTPEQRLSLPAVMQIANGVHEAAVTRTTQQLSEQTNDQQREEYLVDSANDLYDDIMNGRVESGDALTGRMEEYAEVAGDTRQSELNSDVQAAIFAVAQRAGIKTIPAEVVQIAGNAETWYDSLTTYFGYMVEHAKLSGNAGGKAEAERASKGSEALDRARLTDEITAELKAKGWREPGVPPSLGEGTQFSSGGFDANEYKRRLESGEPIDPEQVDALGRQYAAMA